MRKSMLNDIFVKKVNDIEFVAKEEKDFGKLNVFINKRITKAEDIGVKRIVYLDYSEKRRQIMQRSLL